MPKPLLLEIRDKPLTSLIVGICSATWVYLNYRRYGYAHVGTSYQKVVEEKEYWRLLTSQVSHVDWMHLMLNMSSLWSLGFVEKSPQMGMVYYCKMTAILMIGSKLLLLGFYFFMIRVLKREYYRTVVSVGYSSVIFGWMSSLSVGGHRTSKFRMLGLTSVPMSLAPFASLVMTSILIPRASFFGHLSGILVGYLIGLGCFDWVNTYWGVSIATWLLIGLFASVAQTHGIGFPFLQFDREDEQLFIDPGIP